MAELIAQPGELRMVIEITRAATGKKETVELTGTMFTRSWTEGGPQCEQREAE